MSDKPHDTSNPLLEDERKKSCLPLGSGSSRIHVAGLGRRFGLSFFFWFSVFG